MCFEEMVNKNLQKKIHHLISNISKHVRKLATLFTIQNSSKCFRQIYEDIMEIYPRQRLFIWKLAMVALRVDHPDTWNGNVVTVYSTAPIVVVKAMWSLFVTNWTDYAQNATVGAMIKTNVQALPTVNGSTFF